MPDTDQAAELAALRRRVLDMALGAFGNQYFSPILRLSEQVGIGKIWVCAQCGHEWLSKKDGSRSRENFCWAVHNTFNVNPWLNQYNFMSLDELVAALYAAGKRA